MPPLVFLLGEIFASFARLGAWPKRFWGSAERRKRWKRC